ncbi:hypothetical protein [uncultured Sphingomonas sp.]|uniref:hypothetical protein n=1 Tax=uncultured Sphingomonas sp. TaxID=158754 RepID=UPI0035CC7E76
MTAVRNAIRAPMLAVVALMSSPGAGRLPVPAPPPPGIVGQCAFTTISWVGQRLADASGRPLDPSPGSSVTLANGVRGVAYEDVPAIQKSHVGDRVMTCLAKLPTHCPPGDDRGKWYTTTNLRTDESWMLPDAEHMCGGA